MKQTPTNNANQNEKAQSPLQYLRTRDRISQATLGQKIGVTRSTICQYEKGNRQPDNDTLIRIADFFDVSVDFLLGRPLPNLKLADVLNTVRGEKELVEFLKDCGLNEAEIKTTQENPKELEIATLKKIFDHSNKKAPFEQLLFSAGKTYEDLVAEATSKFKRPPQPWTNEEKTAGVIPEYREPLSADEIGLLDAYRAIKDEKGEKAAHAIKTIVLAFLDGN